MQRIVALLNGFAVALILTAGVGLAYQALTENWAVNETVGWTVFWFGSLLAVLPESLLSPLPLFGRWGEIPAALIMLLGVSIRVFWQPEADAGTA